MEVVVARGRGAGPSSARPRIARRDKRGNLNGRIVEKVVSFFSFRLRERRRSMDTCRGMTMTMVMRTADGDDDDDDDGDDGDDEERRTSHCEAW